jgi:hypothetical protein
LNPRYDLRGRSRRQLWGGKSQLDLQGSDLLLLLLDALLEFLTDSHGNPSVEYRADQAKTSMTRQNDKDGKRMLLPILFSAESAGVDGADQFRETTKSAAAGKGVEVARSDLSISRYACYLIAW